MTFDASRITLLELTPETGRPHQLRVHLASIGCPVVGDPLYDPRQRPAPRLCLHAHSLTIPHPATGEAITFTAPAAGLVCPQPAADPHSRPGRPRAPAELRALLRQAVACRAPLAADPQTSIYRLVNAAADGLPGLTVDRYGQTLVLSLYDEAQTFLPPPCPEPVIAALADETGAQRIYVKYRPKEAGRILEAQAEALAPRQPIFGPAQDEAVAHEDGLAYLIRPGVGLSVGLFPDMRETRGRVRGVGGGQAGAQLLRLHLRLRRGRDGGRRGSGAEPRSFQVGFGVGEGELSGQRVCGR